MTVELGEKERWAVNPHDTKDGEWNVRCSYVCDGVWYCVTKKRPPLKGSMILWLEEKELDDDIVLGKGQEAILGLM